MQGMPTAQDVRAEQDHAAMQADEAANRVSAEIGMATSERAKLPDGPSLQAEGLEEGIMLLAGRMKEPEQTRPEFVSQIFGVPLSPDETGKRAGAQGALGSVSYSIAVWSLYADAPGQHVSVRVEPSGTGPCVFDFGRLAKQLERDGYAGKSAPRSLDPSWLIQKSWLP